MILTKLWEYANTRMSLPPEMYGETKIRWLIELNSDGTLLGDGFIPLGGDTKANKKGKSFVVPQLIRSSGIKPKLLADNGEYVLGIPRSNSKPDRVAESHRQFVELVQECAAVTQEPSVQAVVQFLTSDWDKTKLPANFDPVDNITFRVNGVIPSDVGANLQSVQKFWATYTTCKEDNGQDEENFQMTCLVTGENGSVEKRLPVKIKGIPGGQTAGTSLVSANAPPFSSYGLQNSLTSPISRDAGEKFAKALNHLIATESSRIYVGSVVYVFWTREKLEYDFWNNLKQPQPEDIKDRFQSPLKGQRIYESGECSIGNQFYALALSASGGRAVVRDWIETTIPQAVDNLNNWFESQKIVNAYGEFNTIPYLSVFKLAESMYRDPKKEMIPAVPIALIRLALKGGQLPNDMLARLLCRNRVERDVTYARAALIKLILTNQNYSMTEMHQLNPSPDLDLQDSSAYHCGRLLAELEAIQREALGKVNTTLVDRYYGAASSTPAKVFGPLIRGAQANLSTLRKKRFPVYNALQLRLEEILVNLSPACFPTILTMQQQSLFALGYYHQRGKNRKDAADAKAANNAKAKKLTGDTSNDCP